MREAAEKRASPGMIEAVSYELLAARLNL